MSLDDVRESLADNANRRNRWIGVYVGFLAVMLAICSTLGGNAAKDAARANLDAANLWNFFQAKNMRRTSYDLAADNLELTLKAQAAMPLDVRAVMEAKMKTYRDLVKLYTSDKKKNEGLDELWARAKEIEKKRDIASAKDPYFDWAQALLQIAIVLASISIISASLLPFIVSLICGAIGGFMMFNGNFLLFSIPYVG